MFLLQICTHKEAHFCVSISRHVIYHIAEREKNSNLTFSVHVVEIVAQMKLCHQIFSDKFCIYLK